MTVFYDLVEKSAKMDMTVVKQFVSSETGATSIEYALIVSLIFLAILGSVQGFTNSASEIYGEITSTLTEAISD